VTTPSPQELRLTIRGRWLLPMSGPPVESGWLQIEHGLITALGRGRPSTGRVPVLDLDDAVLIPGLVNAHTHLEFSALDAPLAAGDGLPGWIERLVSLRRERKPAAVDATVAAAIQQGLDESGQAGVTLVGDIATRLPQPTAARPGPATLVFREGLGLRPQAAAAAERGVRADLDRLSRSGRLGGVSPHAPYSVAAGLGRRLVAEAVRRNLPMAMHLCESLEEEELLATGGGPFRHLLETLSAWDVAAAPQLLPPAEWIGLLARGRRGLVVHATHIGRDPEALGRLARHRDRLAVAVCPRTTQLISGHLPPLRLLRAAGLRVAIGTDSRASNPDLSLLPECRQLVDAGLVSPEESLRMATLHGAWALGRDRRSGRLAVGRPADAVILRPAQPAADPWTAVLDPATHITATIARGRLIAGQLPRRQEAS
jgi:cytosine/adenosine deaminase-related metal-dependent hydrolase